MAFKKTQPKVEVLTFSAFERHASNGILHCSPLARAQMMSNKLRAAFRWKI